jgi:hypothetical protein
MFSNFGISIAGLLLTKSIAPCSFNGGSPSAILRTDALSFFPKTFSRSACGKMTNAGNGTARLTQAGGWNSI